MEKVARIRQECQWALQQRSVSIRDLTRLIGRLTATLQAVLPAPLHYRNLQRIKNQVLRQFQDFSTVVILDWSAKEELRNLVAEQPGELEWEGSVGANTRCDSGDRCILAWMGCSFGRGANRRPVVRRRTSASYQPAGVDSRCVCSQNLCSPQEKHSHAPQNGQDSHSLHKQDGRNSITSPCPHSLPAVAVVSPEGDYIIRRTSAWVQQHHSRSRVLASSLVSRVDAQQGYTQLDNGGPRSMSIGSVCNLTQPPVESVFELEARPVRNGDRCFLLQLEGQRRICLPTICLNR